MRKTKSKNGITLISLVITIVVLLILATVAISMAVDSNGLFARARKAAEDWNKSVGDETLAIENAMLIMNEIGGGSTSSGGTEEPPEEKDTEPPTGSHILTCEAIKKNGTTTIVVTGEDNVGVKQIKKPDESIEEGNIARYDISATGNYDFEIEDTSGNKTTYTVEVPRLAILPEGYTVSSVEGESTIENGLVIYEGTGEISDSNHTNAMENRNQYVWIPVDDINSMVMCKTNTSHKINKDTGLCEQCGASGNLVGKLYATETDKTFKPDKPNTTYTQGSGFREPDDLTSANLGDASSKGILAVKEILKGGYPDKTYGETYDGLIKQDWLTLQQTDFNNMAKSVAKYKGFYISRYEIQKEGNNIASKKGKEVFNNTNWYTMYNLMRNYKKPESNGSIVSQMIWGSQYDQVMMFTLEKARTDGNGDPFIVTGTLSDTRKRITSSDSNGEELLSGIIEADKVCNIYDLENNYCEWTAEAGNVNLRILRGRLP